MGGNKKREEKEAPLWGTLSVCEYECECEGGDGVGMGAKQSLSFPRGSLLSSRVETNEWELMRIDCRKVKGEWKCTGGAKWGIMHYETRLDAIQSKRQKIKGCGMKRRKEG